jgi:threonine synthase
MGMTSQTSAVSLGEGSTPLVPAGRLSHETGYDLHLKLEGTNPTGSFKDRGMVVAVAGAVGAGARAVVCASTGNTAASAAAYAARAGLEAVVLTPAGATATAKRAQAVAAGARLIELRGTFDDCLRICRELGARPGFVLVNSVNPDRIEGQKRVVGELLEQLGAPPDVIALPFGGGGNVTAVAAALDDARLDVRVVVGQAAERATTWASAIRISEPAHAERVGELVASGRIEVVTLTEHELRDAWRRLARAEGAFCEPASAAGLAALHQLGPGSGETAVCILTGHGLKDTEAVEGLRDDTPVVAADLAAVLEAIG